MKRIAIFALKYMFLYWELMQRHLLIRIAVVMSFAIIMGSIILNVITDNQKQAEFMGTTKESPSYYMNNIGEIIIVDETGSMMTNSILLLNPKTIRVTTETNYYSDGSKYIVIYIIK